MLEGCRLSMNFIIFVRHRVVRVVASARFAVTPARFTQLERMKKKKGSRAQFDIFAI